MTDERKGSAGADADDEPEAKAEAKASAGPTPSVEGEPPEAAEREADAAPAKTAGNKTRSPPAEAEADDEPGSGSVADEEGADEQGEGRWTLIAAGGIIAVAAILGFWSSWSRDDEHAEPTPRTGTEAVAQDAAPAPMEAPADLAAPPADAQTTESGLTSRVLEAGTGTAHPGPYDEVTVHYTGWTSDGSMYDSSVARGQPATFRLNEVMAGGSEGVQLMVIGERRRLWIPPSLAYEGRSGPQGALVYDVELIGFTPSD